MSLRSTWATREEGTEESKACRAHTAYSGDPALEIYNVMSAATLSLDEPVPVCDKDTISN